MSGKRTQNTIKTTTCSDHAGRALWSEGPVGPHARRKSPDDAPDEQVARYNQAWHRRSSRRTCEVDLAVAGLVSDRAARR